MQQKCLKSDIYINENYFCDSVEQAIDVDFTLPDFCPDISKIFKCHAVPRILSKSINGNSITIDGNVIITILYCDKDNNFCSYEYVYPFSKVMECALDISGCNVSAKIKCDYINCRAVTGRKIDIHGAVGIFLKIFKRKCREVVCDIDDPQIEIKRVTAPATTPMGYAEKYLLIEEDLPVGNGQPSIQNVIKTNASVSVFETKIINDKAVIKGEMTVCILYCPENSYSPQTVKSKMPFSQIVDIEGVTDSCKCECKAEICAVDVKPKLTSNGEVRCFSINAKLLLSCEAYCKNDILVIEDVFSRKFEAEIMRNKVPFNCIIDTLQEGFNCKKSVELDFNINNVVDLWCSVQNCHTKFETDKMVIYGTLLADMIICDENNIPLYVEKTIDFEYKYPFKASRGIAHCEPMVEVTSCGFTIVSSNCIELLVELGINASIYEKQEISVVSNLNINEDKLIKRNDDTAMVIYYNIENESIWNIAQKFSASVEEIMSVNGIENSEDLKSGMLLIPLNQ